MTMFEVNLVRDRVMAPRRRKILFWGMLLYLGLCGTVLVAIVYTDTYRILEASRNMREAAALQDAFGEEHPEAGGLVPFARSLQKDLETSREKVDAIRELMDERAHLTRILLGLTVPMSPDVVLDDFQLDHSARRLSFTLTVPAEGAQEAAGLITQWNNATNLGREVVGFKTVSREQAEIEGVPRVVMRVEGRLVDEGT